MSPATVTLSGMIVSLYCGAVTAVMGAPLLLVLVRRLKSLSPPAVTGITQARRLVRPWTVIAVAAMALAIAVLP